MREGGVADVEEKQKNGEEPRDWEGSGEHMVRFMQLTP